jgi:hypothetical protein
LFAVAIFAIFDQIWAGAPWAGVGDFINDHAPSIAVSVSASHYQIVNPNHFDGRHHRTENPDDDIYAKNHGLSRISAK